MSAFAIPIMFVVPASNTLATTGSTQALTAGQFSIYRDNAGTDIPLAATAANVGTAKWIQFFQGNNANAAPGKPNKRSDRIMVGSVKEWYKIPTYTTVNPQITTVTDLAMVGGEVLNLTLRLFSNYINDSYWNGLTATVSVAADCLECGDDPCESKVTDATYEALVDAVNDHPLLGQYITASFTGTVVGEDATLVLTGNTLTNPVPDVSDPHNDPYRFDRLSFYTYINKGPQVSQDFEVADVCDIPGTITVTQRGSFRHGSAAEVKQMQENYFSYMNVYKERFADDAYNPEFLDEVAAANYDLYYLKFAMPDDFGSFTDSVLMNEQVIIAVPTGEATTIEAIIVAFAGAVKVATASGAITYSPLTP